MPLPTSLAPDANGQDPACKNAVMGTFSGWSVGFRRVLGAVGIGVLGLFAPVTLVPAASAHAGLESVSPADGATLTKAPTKVVLTFAEDIASIGTVVKVTGPAGSVVSGSRVVSGPKVTQPLSADLVSGAYTVTFRVVSADGHPVSGTTHFTLNLPAPTTTATAVATASPTPTVPVVTATAGPSSANVPGTPLVEAPSSGPGPLGWGIGAVVVVGLGVALARARRRSSAKAPLG